MKPFEIWTLLLGAAGAVGGLATLFVWLEIRPIHIKGWFVRTEEVSEVRMSSSPVHNRARWLIGGISLFALSLALSGYGLYRAERPRIVEKIVEKPVDRIVQKIVPSDCPKTPIPKATRTPPIVKPLPSGQQQSGGHDNNQTGPVIQGPCSNLNLGGSNVQQGNNCIPPDRTISAAQIIALREGVKDIPTEVKIVVEHPTDSESSEYAKMIHGAIVPYHSAEFSAALSYGGQPPPIGLYVLAHTDDYNVLPSANHLYDLMKKAGIPCEAYQVDWVPSGTIRISVGVMPHPAP